MIEILLFLGFLSWNPTLDQVAINRQTLPVAYPLPAEADPDRYDYLLAVPWGYAGLIGQEVFVKTEGRTLGPFLVVDVQAPEHHFDPVLNMANNNLAADVNCPELVHRRVEIVLVLW